MNLKAVLERSASRYGSREALVYGDRRLFYTDLLQASNRLASALQRSGIKKGDRVALFLSNTPEFLISFFGITGIGAIALPLDQQYKFGEMRSILSHASPAAIISEQTALDVLAPLIPECDSIQLVIETGTDGKGRFPSFNAFLASGSTEWPDSGPLPEDIAAIMYTSSPSFQPRGVMLSHDSFVKEAMASSEGYHQTADDIMMLFALPMFHVFGLVAAGLSSIYSGSSVVLVPGTGLSIGSFMTAIEREKGTMFPGVPYIFTLAVDMAEKGGLTADISSLRLCASAGAPLSPSIAARFTSLFGYDIMDCYGLTEAVCHITCPSIDTAPVPGSVGKPLSGWEIKIAGENGDELPPGRPGEMLVAGPIMKGYFHDPGATEDAIKDGWLHTGDIGMKDEDGLLYVTGRKKETIIVKGQNVFPSDIECVIAAHPGVDDVAVMGLPDAMRGEIIGAVVTPKSGYNLTVQEIRQTCLERIAGYKVPKSILFTGQMPRTAGGEIDKDALRQRLSLPPVFPVA